VTELWTVRTCTPRRRFAAKLFSTYLLAGARVTYTPRLDIGLVAAHLVPLFTALFGLMTSPSYVENEYLMRTLMRVVAFVKDAVAPYTSQVIDGLTSILVRACANPANPVYNHMLFETLAALMKSVCSTRPDAIAAFEAMVFPPFQVCCSVKYPWCWASEFTQEIAASSQRRCR
jgi:exportin-2 (importin alpha re-exporter)